MRYLILMLIGMWASGCATLMNSDYQAVLFSSEPQGAMVSIDGMAKGRTPCSVEVARKGWDKQIMMTLEGYEIEIFTLEANISATSFANIIFWPGFIVDGVSGRAGKFQGKVHVIMRKSGEAILPEGEGPS